MIPEQCVSRRVSTERRSLTCSDDVAAQRAVFVVRSRGNVNEVGRVFEIEGYVNASGIVGRLEEWVQILLACLRVDLAR